MICLISFVICLISFEIDITKSNLSLAGGVRLSLWSAATLFLSFNFNKSIPNSPTSLLLDEIVIGTKQSPSHTVLQYSITFSRKKQTGMKSIFNTKFAMFFAVVLAYVSFFCKVSNKYFAPWIIRFKQLLIEYVYFIYLLRRTTTMTLLLNKWW